MSTIAKRVAPKDEDLRAHRIAHLVQRIIVSRKELVNRAAFLKHSEVRYLMSVISAGLDELRAYGVPESEIPK